jgi:hypothetical protein
MILMALVSVVMIFGLPYLMDNSMSIQWLTWLMVSRCANVSQWIRRWRPKWRRCRRKVLSLDRAELLTQVRVFFISQFERTVDANSMQYKISTSRGGWLEGRVRRNDGLMSAKLLYHLVRTPISDTLYNVWI